VPLASTAFGAVSYPAQRYETCREDFGGNMDLLGSAGEARQTSFRFQFWRCQESPLTVWTNGVVAAAKRSSIVSF
jgi:hypothetical protein